MSNHLSAKAACLAMCGGVVVLLAGCASPGSLSPERELVIRWQRLVDSAGDTCDRCGGTERSIAQARRTLAASLKPLGLHVRVIKTQLSASQFKLDPGESNRIWIGEETLETILGARTSASICSGCCGDSPCRTTVIDGQTYETIPAELIVRAGLRAAADLVQPSTPSAAGSRASDEPRKAADAYLQPMPWLSICE